MTDNGKQLYSLEVEEALIGGLLIDPDWMGRMVHMLGADDFYLAKHKAVWSLLVDLHIEGRSIDYLTLVDEARQRGVLDVIGGDAAVTDYLTKTPTSMHTEHYAVLAREYRISRALVDACQKTVTQAYSGSKSTVLLDTMRSATRGAEKLLAGQGTGVHLKPSLSMFMDTLDHRVQTAGTPKLSFPWQGVADLMPFLEGGDMVGVLAEPGVGKTAFLECCAEAWARQGWKVQLFHFELSTQRMLDRRMQRMSGVPIKRLQDGGQVREDDYPKIVDAVNRMSKWSGDIEYIHCPGWSMSQVVAHIHRAYDRNEVDVVLLDYLNKVRMVDRGNMNSAQSRGADIEDFKVCLETLGLVGVMAGQFDKAAKRMRSRSLADARDTGELEDKANVGFVIDRPRDNRGARPANTKLQLVKCNAGIEGVVEMVFKGDRLLFEERRGERDKPAMEGWGE
jgi:replicative DNA helicase